MNSQVIPGLDYCYCKICKKWIITETEQAKLKQELNKPLVSNRVSKAREELRAFYEEHLYNKNSCSHIKIEALI